MSWRCHDCLPDHQTPTSPVNICRSDHGDSGRFGAPRTPCRNSETLISSAFAVPITAMACDVGDLGDRRASRAPPYPLCTPNSTQDDPRLSDIGRGSCTFFIPWGARFHRCFQAQRDLNTLPFVRLAVKQKPREVELRSLENLPELPKFYRRQQHG